MKTFLKKLSIAFILFASIFLSACEKEGQNKPNKPVDPRDCNNYGTFTHVPCGLSIYGNYWIKLDNGTYLQPCETDVLTRCPMDIYEGMRIKFGHTTAGTDNPCQAGITCLIATPPAARIRITCLEILSQSECTTTGVIVYDDRLAKPCNPKVIKVANGSMIEPVNQALLNNFKNGDKVTLSYKEVLTFAATCSGYLAVELTCFNGKPYAMDCKALTIGDDINPSAGTVHVYNAYTEGNSLKLDVGFSGCNDDPSGIQLIWDGNAMESYPAKVTMTLTTPGYTTCQAYHRRQICFDLSSMKKNPGEKYSIALGGWPQPLLF